MDVDPGGNVTVAWTGDGNSQDVGVWVARYQPSSGWSAPVRLSTEDIPSSPAVAAALDGGAIVTWIVSGTIKWSMFSAQSEWSAAKQLSFVPTAYDLKMRSGTSGHPFLVVHGPGTAAVQSALWAIRWTGQDWGTPFRVDDQVEADIRFWDVIVGPLGQAAVTFVRLDGASLPPYGATVTVWSNYFEPGGDWQGPFRLGSTTSVEPGGYRVQAPPIAMSALGDGGVTIAWTEYREADHQVWTNQRRIDLGWQLTPVQVPTAGYSAYVNKIVQDAHGMEHVFWDDGTGALSKSARVSDNPWSPSLKVGGATAPILGAVAFASGKVLLVDAETNVLQWSAGSSSWKAETLLEGLGLTQPAMLATLGDVDAVVVGRRGTSDGDEVAVSRFFDPDHAVALAIDQPNAGWLRTSTVEVAGQTDGAWLRMNDNVVIIEPNGRFHHTLVLADGTHDLFFEARGRLGQTTTYTRQIRIDTLAPPVEASASSGSQTEESSIAITGKTDAGAALTVNGRAQPVHPDGTFVLEWPLHLGSNQISLVVTDEAGNTGSTRLDVAREFSIDTVAGDSVESPWTWFIFFGFGSVATVTVFWLRAERRRKV